MACGVTPRIGNVNDMPLDKRRLSIWIKPEDLAQLVRIGLEHPDIRFEVFYGASDNDASWWDNSNARRFGYRPQFRSQDFQAQALAEQAKLPADPIGDRLRADHSARRNMMPTANRERQLVTPNKNPARKWRGFAN